MSEQPDRGAHRGTVPENYEQYFVPTIGAPLASDLIETATLCTGERVLDVACGTGVVTRLASQRVGDAGTVTGLDINPGMLAVARQSTPPGAAIEWYEASAEAIPFPDASFDVVLCQMGLQFLADKRAALSEMWRVLAPGGRLILNVPGPAPELFDIMGKAFARHIGADAAGFVYHVFSLHEPAELQKLVEDAGFHEVSVQANTRSLPLPAPAEFLWQYVNSTPLAGVLGQVDDAVRGSMRREILSEWQEFVKDGTFVLQVRMVVATARRRS
jgi:ubiquinone/menaquinone biosynthesis C-methylase UbiE